MPRASSQASVPAARPARGRTLALAALAGALAIGCGDRGPQPQRVSGAVTFDGKPLQTGSIELIPADPDRANATGAPIRDGRYEISRENGPVPGSFRIMIYSAQGDSPKAEAMPGAPGLPAQEMIPPRYNVQTTLAAEVEDGGANTFDFELKK